jgi:hypothetical protein
VLAHLVPAFDAAGDARRTRHREDLYGVRDYQPGDDIGRIHWRSSARRGALVVREFERPVAMGVTLLLDLDRGQTPERLDAGVHAAASVLQAARDHGVAMTIAGWEETLVEHRQWEAAMDWLSGVTPCGPPLLDVLPHIRGGGPVVAVASAAVPVTDAGVLLIVPAGGAGAHAVAARLVYTEDGTVQAW